MDYNPAVSLSKHNFRAVVRLTAILLLAWTALDLTATQLCAADNRPWALNEPAPEDVAGPSSSTPVPQGHIDDCFCCSHCVNVALLVPLRATPLTTACDPSLDTRVPSGDGCPLFHPPQLS